MQVEIAFPIIWSLVRQNKHMSRHSVTGKSEDELDDTGYMTAVKATKTITNIVRGEIHGAK